MRDQEVLEHIRKLVDEEHRLLQEAAQAPANDPRHTRLREVAVSLDQCWDLLRQRRARRLAGEDPDAARPRDPNVVERYLQ